ncbi:MAG: hypothetical protein AAF390_19205, partial [Pseudomonadota bacterium]
VVRDWVTRARTLPEVPFEPQLRQLEAEVRLDALLDGLRGAEPRGLLRRIAAAGLSSRVQRAGTGLARARALKAALVTAHRVLRTTVAALQPQARAAFEARVASERMDPALGLLVAELRAAEEVEARMNAVVDRHTRFYYGDLLGQAPRPAGRETVLLGLRPGPKPVFLPEGSRLEARLPDKTIQTFVTDRAVHVSPARVGRVAGLTYRSDPGISFAAAFGAVTDVAATSGPTTGPLFSAPEAVPAEMGLDISSKMLALAEGRRLIELRLNLGRASDLPAQARPLQAGETPVDPDDPDPELLLALRSDPALLRVFRPGATDAAVADLARRVGCLARRQRARPALCHLYEVLAAGPMPDVAALRLLLSRWLFMCLIEAAPFPTGRAWCALRGHVRRHRVALSGLDLDSAVGAGLTDYRESSLLRAFAVGRDGTIGNAPADVFQKLLGRAFDIRLSTADGMRRPETVHVAPNPPDHPAGLTVRMSVADGAPAVTGAAPGAAPHVAIRLSPETLLCPVTVLERYALSSVEIDVQVEGLRKLVAFSDTGMVATDQTFLPFGMQPDDGATFVAGCAEMAEKPVIGVGVDLAWTDLPDRPGGFAPYAAAYGKDLPVPAPELRLDYLSGDGWKAVAGGKVEMCDRDPITDRLRPEWRGGGQVQGHSEPAQGPVAPRDFASRQTIRAGLVRLTLSGTAGGFHAQRYPLALVAAMRPR